MFSFLVHLLNNSSPFSENALDATSFSPFYGGFNKLRIGENNTLLVDGTGRAIYHTDPGQMGQDFGGQEAIQRALGGATGHLYVRDAQGRDILATFAPVPGTSWGLVNEENWAGLLASSRNYGYMLLALLALGVAIPAAVVAVGLRRLTEPMASLIAGAKEVASGKFGQAIRVRTSDELEELVNQFNLMSAQLKAREERLDLIVHGTIDGIWDWNFLTGEVYLSPRWKAMLGFGEDEERNWLQEMPALLHPEDLPNVAAQIQAQVDRPHYTVEYRLRHRDGSYRWILARGVALKDDEGRPYRVAGSQTDITELKRAQEALQQAYQTLEQRVEERTREIERRRQVAEGLREIVTVLNSRQSLPDILEVIATQARRLLGSDAMALYRLDRETNALSILAAHGLDPDYVASMAIPVGKGAVGLAVYRSEPVKVLDAVASMAVVSDPTLTMQKRSMLEALISRYRSLLAVPLIIKDDIYGAITLYYQSFREFTDEEISLVVSFADQAALAIENARLREQAEQAAVVAERNRLARDLHDAVTQSLYSVTLYAEAAVRLLNSGDHTTAAKHLRELRDTAQEALREMRLLIFELRPLALEKSGLAAALQARLEAVEGRTGIQVELNVVGAEYADGLPYGVQEELYHIAQEALNNVLKHAHARHVRVSLSVSEGATCLEISDDGVSFDPAQAAQAGGLGLAGMKERAQKIGGTIGFDSAPGQGTKVTIRVPVSATAIPTIPKTTQPSSQPVGD